MLLLCQRALSEIHRLFPPWSLVPAPTIHFLSLQPSLMAVPSTENISYLKLHPSLQQICYCHLSLHSFSRIFVSWGKWLSTQLHMDSHPDAYLAKDGRWDFLLPPRNKYEVTKLEQRKEKVWNTDSGIPAWLHCRGQQNTLPKFGFDTLFKWIVKTIPAIPPLVWTTEHPKSRIIGAPLQRESE